MAQKTPITVAKGDGIGPEIMDATLRIIQAAGAQLELEEIEIGEKVYLRGNSAGIEPTAYDSLRRTKVFLKAPITTPQGGGFKSLNVTTRKAFGLYANIRPCVSYYPFVRTKHPKLDLVIVRENEEDLYAGIEHRQTHEVIQCLKLISRPGSEKICRYAFEYARMNNRKKVTCFTKDNIMKMTDGLFHKIFDEIAAEYPDIQNEHWIVDIGSAKMADTPEVFDVIVLPNLYGDILSDVAAQIAGSVGLAGSANIGEQCAMFEAIHGSAPRHAGKNSANPSGLFLGSILMLVHINQPEAAEAAHNAWLKTIEDGIHTYDIFDPNISKEKVGTKEFADAVIARIGKKPEQLKAVSYKHAPTQQLNVTRTSSAKLEKKELVGVDVFLHYASQDAEALGEAARKLAGPEFEISIISNRGMKIWPGMKVDTMRTDNWRCRFFSSKSGQPVSHSQIVALLGRFAQAGFDFIKTEHLYTFDGQPGFTQPQGA
ncbi:MAG: NADP-dependent isocitrate dehydrogenase [Candidatus Sumerlaeaceae bacterium]|nr:NADP-dependent isocitrate dehydrogenase [Candidatus Sumerlaeaceae bacterium]